MTAENAVLVKKAYINAGKAFEQLKSVLESGDDIVLDEANIRAASQKLWDAQEDISAIVENN